MVRFRTHVYIKLSQANIGTIHKDVVEYSVDLRIPQKKLSQCNTIEILPQLETNLQSSYTCGPNATCDAIFLPNFQRHDLSPFFGRKSW